jgi:hypothetical protein
MVMEGVKVSAEEVDGGVALVFTTESGDVAELRRRGHEMAAHHEQRAGHGMPMHGGRPMAGRMAPDSEAAAPAK